MTSLARLSCVVRHLGGAFMRDAAWFEKEWRTADGLVMSLCMQYAPQGEHEDCYSVTMQRAWESREQFDGGRPFKNWAARMAQNICADARRYNGRRFIGRNVHELDALNEDGLPHSDTIPDAHDLFADLATDELRRRIIAQINALPSGQRDAMHCLVQGRDQDEAAVALGIPRGTLRSRINRARAVLLSSDLFAAEAA